MHNRQSHASSLFLLELVLAILFFSIASAVCVQLFVKAHLTGSESRALSHAVTACSSVAETLETVSSAEEALALLQQQYPEAAAVTDAGVSVFEVFFDESFAAAAPSASGTWYLRTALQEEDGMLRADTGFYHADDGSAVYELRTWHHIPGRISS